jgi:hypothetical protein
VPGRRPHVAWLRQGACREAFAAMAEPSSAAVRDSIRFDFRHLVFAVPGARFTRSGSGETVLVVSLDGADVPVPLAALRAEFAIGDDTADGRLLALLERALDHVGEIRPGDSVPRGLLDGSASWRLEARHVAIAKGRLAVRLSAWLGGDELIAVEDAALERLIDDPLAKVRMKAATSALAEKLGLGARQRRQVIDRVDDLARELAYVEALRERHALVQSLLAKMDGLAGLFADDRAVARRMAQLRTLLRWPADELETLLGQADAIAGDPLIVLRSFAAHVNAIREMRDALIDHLAPWEDMLELWGSLAPERSPMVEAALGEIHQFAVRRFPEAAKRPTPGIRSAG